MPKTRVPLFCCCGLRPGLEPEAHCPGLPGAAILGLPPRASAGGQRVAAAGPRSLGNAGMSSPVAAHDKDPGAGAGTAPLARVVLCPHAAARRPVAQTTRAPHSAGARPLTGSCRGATAGPPCRTRPRARGGSAPGHAPPSDPSHLHHSQWCVGPVASHTAVGALT